MTDELVAGLAAFALRATVLLVTAWAATRLLRRAAAATRHLVWTGAIAGVLALPVLAVLVPAWNVPIVSISARFDGAEVSANAARETSTPVSTERDAAVANHPAASTSPPIAPAPRIGPAAGSRFERWSSGVSIQAMVAAAWLALAFLMLARLAVANARLSSWQRSSLPVEDERWLALLRRLTRQYHIERPVVLLENGQTDVPVTWGIVYPVILLPAAARGWDEEQRVAVLTHELAHVKRFDALSQILAQIALALLWFHPLAWTAVRRMRLEREHACDDFVLVAGTRASRYADDLLALARRLTRPTAPAAAALAMARRSELEGRLLAILDPAMKRTAVRRARVGLLTVAVLALAAPLAAFRPAARVAMAPLGAQLPEPRMGPSLDSAPAATVPRNKIARPPAFADQGPPRASMDLDAVVGRVAVPASSAASPTLEMISGVPSLRVAVPVDTEPPVPVDVATLIAVARGAKRMTSDFEKGQLLALIVKRYQPVDSLRDAYLDAVFSMTSDYERTKALTAFLDRDSLPLSSTARVLQSAAGMTSDMSRGAVLRRISPSTFADSAVQRAYLTVIVAMTNNTERASAIGALARQRPLTPAVQLGLMRAIGAISSNTEKAGAMLLFAENQGLADEAVRKAYFKTAESLTSDHDYRRVIAAVVR